MNVACILLAAGRSRRMLAHHKLLLDAFGFTVIRRTTEAVVQARFSEVVVITGDRHAEMDREVTAAGGRPVHNPNFDLGQHASIRAGLEALRAPFDFVAIALGDQPLMLTHDYNFLITRAQDHAAAALIVPMRDGQRGHPVLIAARLVPEIYAEPDNDRGCQYLFARYPQEIAKIEMTSAACVSDIDTPEAYARFREQAAAEALWS